MSTLFSSIRNAVPVPREDRPVCIACGRRLAPGDPRLRLRGGAVAHHACATYGPRRKRTGDGGVGRPSA